MINILEEEQQYLEFAKGKLQEEKEYCEKELRELPKRYTSKLQGDSFLVQGLMSTVATKLRKLEMSENSLYFGRIDFLSDGSNEAVKIYIGKTNIAGENQKNVITDWRAPICSLYYDSDMGNVSYNAPQGIINGELKLKRQIVIQNGELVDVLDTNLISNDELLQPYLSVNADNKMKTIIASIQKEQNQIIRKPINENIIIQGVAGSGKTSVALHRIAYLVYSLGENIKSNQFLVIGPNKYFLNYISSILPELETEPVDQQTFIDLVIGMLGEKLVLDEKYVIDNDVASEKTKKIQAYKSSLSNKENLDSFLKLYLEKSIISKGFEIDDQEIFSAELIKSVLFSGINKKPNFESASNYFVKKYKDNIENIYEKLNQKYRSVYMSLPIGTQERNKAVEKSVELSRLVKEKGIKLLKDYFKKMKLNPTEIYKLYINNIDKFNINLLEEEINEMQAQTLLTLKKKKVGFEDLPAILHIKNVVCGNVGIYRHIVIDEAQDYGLFHFDVLKETFPNSTFSIYGDLAQSIYTYKSINNWETVVKNIFDDNCEILKLSKSYRTTMQITNNANNILNHMNLEQAEPVIRHGKDTSFNEFSKNLDYKIAKIKQWKNSGYKTVALICKTDKEAKQMYDKLLLNNLAAKHITVKDTEYGGGVFVLTSALSKGLEFDAVLINDASSNVYDESNMVDIHLLYVASTRALHELEILFDKELCSVFSPQSIIRKKTK